jgi:hypothetical protein
MPAPLFPGFYQLSRDLLIIIAELYCKCGLRASFLGCFLRKYKKFLGFLFSYQQTLLPS